MGIARKQMEEPWAHIPRAASLSTQTYERTKALIISCELEPGQQINEIDLSRRLGISRSPLREAFRRLEEEQFVEIPGGRGLRVSPITPQKALHLYEYRCVLESFAATKAAGSIDASRIVAAAADLDQVAAELDAGNIKPFNDSDFAFHDLYINRCENYVLIHKLHRLRDQLLRVWNFVGYRLEHTRLSLDEHLSILSAMRSGKGEPLRRAVEKHIMGVGQRVSEFVAELQ